jgi:hypothetical protein
MFPRCAVLRQLNRSDEAGSLVEAMKDRLVVWENC